MKCTICGIEHEFKCALIKAYEYYPEGGIKRVEFVTIADMQQGQQTTLPAHTTLQ